MSDPASQKMGGAHMDLQIKLASASDQISGKDMPGAVESVIELRESCDKWLLAITGWVESRKEGS